MSRKRDIHWFNSFDYLALFFEEINEKRKLLYVSQQILNRKHLFMCNYQTYVNYVILQTLIVVLANPLLHYSFKYHNIIKNKLIKKCITISQLCKISYSNNVHFYYFNIEPKLDFSFTPKSMTGTHTLLSPVSFVSNSNNNP